MKNIEAICAECTIEIPEDKKAEFLKLVGENYKTISDWQNQKDKVESLTQQLNTAKENLKKFEGVDAEELKKQVADLTKQLSDQEHDYNAKIADRDFQDLIGQAITKHKGINAKAIQALLDVESLKKSKNQEADIEKAIVALTEADDSKMLFGSDPVGNVNPIGSVGNGSSSDNNMSKMRAIMGLPPEQNTNNNKGE